MMKVEEGEEERYKIEAGRSGCNVVSGLWS